MVLPLSFQHLQRCGYLVNKPNSERMIVIYTQRRQGAVGTGSNSGWGMEFEAGTGTDEGVGVRVGQGQEGAMER